MSTYEILPLILIMITTGVVAGFLAGLLGVGGGIIFVPVMYFLFINYFKLVPDIAITVAAGTSLACMIPTSLSSCLSHYKKGNLDLDLIKQWSIVLILGVICGSIFSSIFGGRWLSLLFGSILLLSSFNMLLRSKAPPISQKLPPKPYQYIIPFFVSSVSVMLGIGGGTLSVPILTACNIQTHKAIGTAAAIGLFICFPGAIWMLAFTNTIPETENLFCLGKVCIVAVLCIVPFSFLIAPLGVKVNKKLNQVLLKRLFGILLIFTGVKMLLSAI